MDTGNLRSMAAAAHAMFAHTKQCIIITLGARGMLAVYADGEIAVPGIKVEVVDTTGAGDCFIGALASRLAKGKILESALNYANYAASLSVQRIGANPSMPTESEVD